MSPVIFLLMQFAILAYALVAGVFLAFSDFIMRSGSVKRSRVEAGQGAG